MDVFKNVEKQIKKVSDLMNLDENTQFLLKNPKRALTVSIPVQMDDGSTKHYVGHRVQFNDARGPTKGGIRFHQNVNISEVKSLAFWMAVKCSVVGIPYGGGKGGVEVNPKELSERELENLSRGYIKAIHKIVGPTKDIPAPDVYTTPQIMAWMLDEYEKITGEHHPGLITGKPLELGGSQGRGYSTAMGGAFVLKEIAKEFGLEPKSTTVAIQGFGNAGLHMARILNGWNYKIIAVSDSKGGIVDEKGFDVPALIKHKESGKSVVDFGGKKISNEDLLELECDVLVPAALENVITEDNTDKIKGKYVIELANGPVTPEADEILHKNSIFVAPDVLANAGGVTVSYFEWVQNLYGYYWTEEEVNEKLEKIMVTAFNECYEKTKEFKTHMRNGTYIKALERILTAEKLRGNI